jgi:glycosyltransferase involved in cell wall biosynthesis
VKVLHVVVAGAIGGAERMLADLASRPRATCAEHAVAAMTPNPQLVQLLRGAGVRVHDRGLVRENVASYLWRSLGPADVAWLGRVLREERANIVHLHTFASQVVGTRAARRIGARVVRTEHSTRVYVDATCWPFSRWSLEHADALVAVSAHVRGVTIEKAPCAESKLRLVYDGVDVERFAPREEGRNAGDPFRFVLVGRLEPRKGVDLAIAALAHVPHAVLDVVGDGHERSRLEALTREHGVQDRVIFHGYLEDTRPAVARAQAAVCSSREEGLGLALLEAMAMARPVVGFAVGGVPETVSHGETGWLTREQTAPALAARMREAAADPGRARALGHAAHARVAAAFSVDRMCRGYAEVYASLG